MCNELKDIEPTLQQKLANVKIKKIDVVRMCVCVSVWRVTWGWNTGTAAC